MAAFVHEARLEHAPVPEATPVVALTADPLGRPGGDLGRAQSFSRIVPSMADAFDGGTDPPGDALTVGDGTATMGQLLASAAALAARTSLGDTDRLLSGRPLLDPAGAAAGLLAPLACGAGVVLVSNFNPARFWRRVADERVTVAVLDPVQAVALRHAAPPPTDRDHPPCECSSMTERSSDRTWTTTRSPEGCRDVVLCRLLPNGEEMSMKLSVVVPFYNELRTLPTVIDRLLNVDFSALGLETELIFVDDGSTDAGRSLLDPLPRDDVRLIVHPTNRGKGAAVKTGLEAATGDILCIQDADLEYDPRDLPALIEPILDGDYEVVYGSRFRGSAAGLYYTHRIANRLLNLMVNVAFNRYLSDVYTGYKVFTRQAFRGLKLTARTFTVEMELTAHFLRKGLVIFEVPISYRARTYAEGKKIHFKDGFLAAGAVARYRLRPPPEVTGPASFGAPDEPGVMRAVEGGATIHTLGLEDLATAHRYRRYLHGLLAPYLGPTVLEVGAGLATSRPSCWTATAWWSTTTTRSASGPWTSASASVPASRSWLPTSSSSRWSRRSTRSSP